MSDYPHRVQIESVRWIDVFPALHLFGSIRKALGPPRMFLALLLVVLTLLGGKALDFIWGDRAYRNEFESYQRLAADDFDSLIERLDAVPDAPRQPIFQTLLDHELDHFNRMVSDAISLNFGLTELVAGQPGGVLGEMRIMVITAPGWMLRAHPGFSVVLLLYTFVLTVILGGAIARLAALDACRDVHGSPFAALRFALGKAGWLIAAPLLPVVLVAILACALAVMGLAFFNVKGLDVFGAMLFFLFLAFGALAAVIVIGLAVVCHLLTPAIAVEDSDAFDAVSRSFSYVLAHPWRYAFYLAVSLVYGAAGYLLLGLVLFLTLWATKAFTSWGLFTEVGEGMTRLDAILPDPQLGRVMQPPAVESLDGSGKIAATLVAVWVKLLLGLLPAYCVSYYFTATTWVYLLLRRHTDGAAFDEMPITETPAAAPEKVEPASVSVPHEA